MLTPHEQDYLKAARAEARGLGYMLFVDPTGREHEPHAVSAAPVIPGQASTARHLSNGTSFVDAVDRGLETLHRIVEEGEPWPSPDDT